MNPKPDIYTINSNAIQFLSLKNAFELSRLFDYEFSSFKRTIEKASYRTFKIPKAKGGFRTIEAPKENLIFIQKNLNTYLQAVYCKIKPSSAYGFVKSLKDETHPRTILSNASSHTGKNYVLNIDLKDFFHAISANQVKALFLTSPFNFNEDLATCLALICCWNKRLPMGAPTSPVVSNLYCLRLDEQLIAIAGRYNLDYTRYADDLTFSSELLISEEAIAAIKNSAAENGFLINERKFRMQSKFSRQIVTGIKVNQKPNVDRRYIRKIRAILNDAKWNGLEKAAIKHYKVKEADEQLIDTFLLSLRGKIIFIGQVRGKEDSIYTKLRYELSLYQPALPSKYRTKI